jgi:hypothetical protein
VRNVPFLIWNETTDELVPIAGVLEQVKKLDELGYRYEFDQFQAGEHLTLALNDEYAPAAAFLGTETIDADPAHVTYTYNPTMDFAVDGTSAGHAYWVYNVGLRDSSGTAPLGVVDVRSQAFGVGDPVPGATQHGAGVLTGGDPVHQPEQGVGAGAQRTGARCARDRRDERRPCEDRRQAREGRLQRATERHDGRPADGHARRVPRHGQGGDGELRLTALDRGAALGARALGLARRFQGG